MEKTFFFLRLSQISRSFAAVVLKWGNIKMGKVEKHFLTLKKNGKSTLK